MSDRVIFLDIDGPMIPSSMYLVDMMCSYKRKFPATTVAVMNELCKRTGAKIVFNTTHNQPFDGVADIEVALVEQGLDATHLHSADLKTAYPGLPRDIAVKEWLARHPEVDEWVALDDVRFTEDRNLVWVDPDTGVTVAHLNEAAKMLGGSPCLIIM